MKLPSLRPEPRFFAGMCVLLVAMVSVARPFRPGEWLRHPWMTFVRDDFFYYLLVARHFAAGQGSTYNGLVQTNGYHPLWMLLLASVCRFSTAPGAILGFVAVTATVATMCVYGLGHGLLERCGVRGWLSALGAAYIALSALPLCYYGMEVTLAMPLALALALHALQWNAQCSSRWWLMAGLLSSALMLARVDAVLLALLLGAGLLSQAAVRRSLHWRAAAALFAGLLPALFYLLLNRVHFGLWLPVSGAAKQLRSGWLPSVNVWASVLDGPRSGWLNLLLIVVAVVLLLVRWRRWEALQRAVLGMLLAYPIAFVLLLSMRSDWEMWPWYAWVWRPATCAAITVILLVVSASPVANRMTPWGLGAMVLLRVSASAWIPGQLDYYQTATAVQSFAVTHPGVYAMGDRAGMIGWLLPAPLVQTEGLVMDKAFLDHVRRQDALLPVLKSYGVRYYIADDWAGESLMQDNCFHAAEPADAGAESPKMRGVLCRPPLFQVTRNEVTTRIYELPSQQTSAESGK